MFRKYNDEDNIFHCAINGLPGLVMLGAVLWGLGSFLRTQHITERQVGDFLSVGALTVIVALVLFVFSAMIGSIRLRRRREKLQRF